MKKILLSAVLVSFMFSNENIIKKEIPKNIAVSQDIVKDKLEENKQKLFSERQFSFNEIIPSKNKYLLNGEINKSILKKDLEDLILTSSILYANLYNKKDFNSNFVNESKYKDFINYITEIQSVELYDSYAIINNNIVLNYRFGNISLKINNLNVIDLDKNKYFELKDITNNRKLLYIDKA